MKYNNLTILSILLISQITISCNNREIDKFELRGKLTGITDGKVILSKYEDDNTNCDTAVITNGEFYFTKKIPEPELYKLEIIDCEIPMLFYAENSKMLLNAKVDSGSLYSYQITGGTVNSDEKNYRFELDSVSNIYKKKYSVDSLFKIYVKTKDEDCKKKIETYFAEFRKVSDEITLNFIKQNPASYYSAILVELNADGKSIAQIEKSLLLLDKSLNETAVVKRIKVIIENLRNTHVSMENFIPNAHNLSYTVEKTYKGADHKNVIYLAVMSNDNLCALTEEGNILMINPAGAKVAVFKSNLTSNPAAIAVDKSDNIYILGVKFTKKNVESRGRTLVIQSPNGVECIVLDSRGNKVKNIDLSNNINASGARIADDKLLVSDATGQQIIIYDIKMGKKITSINNLRSCCNILDFCLKNNDILVANLGAFRVNGFDLSGNSTLTFGERGTDINQFHGCCNPVSVAFLSNGGIVTVEKDPTRIKVYSKEGAKKIEGIDELVKGCAYIPMIVDSKDNVYLASKTNGLVKCAPVK